MWDIKTKSTIYFQPSKRASPIEVYKLQEELSKTIAWVSNKTGVQERNLIATAPELLDALKMMLECFIITMSLDDDDKDSKGCKYRAVKHARAAIAKATGV